MSQNMKLGMVNVLSNYVHSYSDQLLRIKVYTV